MNHIIAIKTGITIAALALVTACASPAQTRLSDGSLAYRIDCDGTAGGLNYCFERAGKTCGAAGYTIIDQDGQTLSEGNVADSGMEAQTRAYKTDQNSILIRCDT